ncbi:hypothetical protein CGRA01v4_04810 [Colletotrichum graminicola]|uniref:Prefoldin subunit n=1 Tax=Colletotrichum graminicola (strain M1.001 / M2 / FGSC 10212) TaxID=645133 RepID=E3QLN6_COLGM|nr:uncharacterized protein GLRG_06749 [Colletotrichum graminicola M1.001]EFQ31774.1 hypothetical protein GLRG_06749 [Colletotrichum graminicola M1.001]WDK13529.1 hypothetical protein CGRA01v4_04810 [Colletotrichum graminicola]
MRLLPISRSHTSVLTRGRWVFAPNWRVFSRRPEYQSSQAVALAQNPSTWQTPGVASSNSASYQQSISSKLPGAEVESHSNERLAISPNQPLVDSSDLCDPDIFLSESKLPAAELESNENERLAITPNPLLIDVLDLYRDPGIFLSESKLARLRALAVNNSTQLVVITAQYILREVPQLDPRIGDLLCSNEKWLAKLHRLARNGLSAGDVSYWAWTLVSPDPDVRVARFMSKPCQKPLFLLCHLLLKNAHFSPDSFEGLLKYCRKWCSYQQIGRGFAKAFARSYVLNPELFNRVAENLCFHASRLQSDALPEIADLSVAYIKSIAQRCQHPDKAYEFQCKVFNGALQAVSVLSKRTPYQQASQNWRAITILLSLSSSLKHPLIIEGESYRAIRQVLLALPKTASERKTAGALSSSWPPYRILRDGMEEKADTQEYLSRVVKAGFMMQEAGYSKKEIDVTTDVLGGMAPDGSPTIQTRAIYPRHLRVEQGTWAALVRATRNAQEAWAAFTNPPESGMRPTFEVYWELMVKLAARQADPRHHNLPGDGREVFPFDDRNLSDFEKARISPPSMPQLIEQMYNAGVAIEERPLAWLLRRAPDIETALEYISHSSVDEALKNSLRQCLKVSQKPVITIPTRPSRPIDLPHKMLHATVDLLCRLQPNRTKNTPDYLPKHKLYSIHHAFRLAQTGRNLAHTSDRPPLELIMLALGRPNIMVSNTAPQDNNIEVVKMALKVLGEAEERGALTLDMLNAFAHAIRKLVYSSISMSLSSTSAMLPGDEEFVSLYRARNTELAVPNGPNVFRRPDAADNVDGSWRQIHTPVFEAQQEQENLQTPCKVVREASERLKAVWRVLLTKASAHPPFASPRVSEMNIYHYMRTLVAVGDLEEAVLLLCWTVRDWAPAAGAKLTPGKVRTLTKAVIVFRAFAEPLLDERAVASLREEIETNSEQGGPVHWPADQQVEEYVQGDDMGNHQNLHEVVKSAASRSKIIRCQELGKDNDVD